MTNLVHFPTRGQGDGSMELGTYTVQSTFPITIFRPLETKRN